MGMTEWAEEILPKCLQQAVNGAETEDRNTTVTLESGVIEHGGGGRS